ncbi:hypothetical protein C9426_29280 [Serratia sp. S1B]|nr:hypothetical protein C9426_29280 [Serratia sp. S1B]
MKNKLAPTEMFCRVSFAYIERVGFSLNIATSDDAIENAVEFAQAKIDLAFVGTPPLNNKACGNHRNYR